MFKAINKKDKLFYARIIPTTGTYDVCELIIRTVTDSWFVGIDKRDKHAYLFGYDSLGETVFDNREQALSLVQRAEENKKQVSDETYYEEY